MMVMEGRRMPKADHDFKVIMYPAHSTHHRLNSAVSEGTKSSQPRIHLNDNNGRTPNHSRLFLLLAQLKWGAEYRPTRLCFFPVKGVGALKLTQGLIILSSQTHNHGKVYLWKHLKMCWIAPFSRLHQALLRSSITHCCSRTFVKPPQQTPCQRMILRLTIL